MNKSTKIDFYFVGEESPDIEIILNNLKGLPEDSSKRIIQHNEDWLRLSRSAPTSNGFFGDMMRISMSPPGFRASLVGEIVPILFAEDEGIAETAAFYYDYESRILALQRNAKAVTVGQFAHYLKQVADADQEIVIKPVLRPTDLGKVRTLSQIRKIHISANIIDVMPTLDDIDPQTMAVIRNSMIAESPSIEVVLKSGKGKEATLNQTVAIETLDSWLKIHQNFSDEENEIVRKIEVNGKDDSGDTIEFDMLKDRMFARMDYEWEPDSDALWEARQQKIQQAWDLNHANLKRNLEA